jgi:hypothetical protein
MVRGRAEARGAQLVDITIIPHLSRRFATDEMPRGQRLLKVT